MRRSTSTKPVRISGGTYNEIAEAVDAVNRSSVKFGGDRLGITMPPGCVPVMWDSGDALGVGELVGFLDANTEGATTEETFLVSQLTSGVPVAPLNNMGKWGVAIDPVPLGNAGRIIPVRVVGPAFVRLFVPTGRGNAKYCDVYAGETQLKTGPFGSEILWKASGTNTTVNAIVMLGTRHDSFYGTTVGATASGGIVSVNVGEYTFPAKHDIFTGDIPASTKVFCVWQPADREAHVIVMGCP